MALNVSSVLTSIENLLVKNNTTSSSDDISSGLTKRVQVFRKGVRGISEKTPLAKNVQYPAIFTELSSKEEELRSIGNNSKRDISVEFLIVPVVDYSGTPGSGIYDSDNEVMILTQNIEGLLRGNITLSSTVSWSEVVSTDWSNQIRDDAHNSVSKITLKTYFINQR